MTPNFRYFLISTFVLIRFSQLEEKDMLRAPDHQDPVPEHEHITQVIFGDSIKYEVCGILSTYLDGTSLSVEAMNNFIDRIEKASLWEVLLGTTLVVVSLQGPSGSPLVDVIDEVMMHECSFLFNMVV